MARIGIRIAAAARWPGGGAPSWHSTLSRSGCNPGSGNLPPSRASDGDGSSSAYDRAAAGLKSKGPRSTQHAPSRHRYAARLRRLLAGCLPGPPPDHAAALEVAGSWPASLRASFSTRLPVWAGSVMGLGLVCTRVLTPINAYKCSGDNHLQTDQRLPKLDIVGRQVTPRHCSGLARQVSPEGGRHQGRDRTTVALSSAPPSPGPRR